MKNKDEYYIIITNNKDDDDCLQAKCLSKT